MSNSEDVFWVFTGFFNGHGWALFDRNDDLSRMEFEKGDIHMKVMIKDGEMGIWTFKRDRNLRRDVLPSVSPLGWRRNNKSTEVGVKRFSKKFADPEFFGKLGLALEKLWK